MSPEQHGLAVKKTVLSTVLRRRKGDGGSNRNLEKIP
jgi:hypothetical protein